MSDEPKPRARDEQERARSVRLVPLDATLAALRDGTIRFDEIDDETLRQLIEHHGAEEVTSAAYSNHAVTSRTSSLLTNLGSQGDRRLQWGATLAVAAAAAALLFVLLREPLPTDDTSETLAAAWSSFEDGGVPGPGVVKNEAVLDIVAAVSSPGWGGGLRGGSEAADEALVDRTVAIHIDKTFGSGVLLDGDGWIVTASSLVAGIVQSAARTGDVPRVEVELATITGAGRIEPRDERKSATVMRHDPGLGLSLLRLDASLDTALLDDVPRLRVAPRPEFAEARIAMIDAGQGVAIDEVAVQALDVPTDRGGFSLLLASAFPVGITAQDSFALGSVGAGVFEAAAPTADVPTLTGVVVGEWRGRTIVARADAVQALLASMPDEREPYPFDPFVVPLGGAITPLDLPSTGSGFRPVRAVRTESSTGVISTTFLYIEGEVDSSGRSWQRPEGMPGSPVEGGMRFDAFVTIQDGQVVAMGWTDEDQQLAWVDLAAGPSIAWVTLVGAGWQRIEEGAAAWGDAMAASIAERRAALLRRLMGD